MGRQGFQAEVTRKLAGCGVTEIPFSRLRVSFTVEDETRFGQLKKCPEWISDTYGIEQYFTDVFKELFQSSNPDLSDFSRNGVRACIC